MSHVYENPIFCALDTTDVGQAVEIAQEVKSHVGGLKIGLEFYNANGPKGARAITDLGVPVFFDLKLHDIPNTVAGGIRAVLDLEPAIINVHASGGRAMMQAAASEASKAGLKSPLVIGVTVLTSLDDQDLADVGVTGNSSGQVLRLAQLAQSSGLGGVVCSALEIAAIRQSCGQDFKLIVPGIRPEGGDAGDQKRIMTPQMARDLGADVLVIGRPITQATSPREAATRIAQSLAAA
jgi:orotidine-5'-phosphate decarboxylase